MGTSRVLFLPLTMRFGSTTHVEVTFSNFSPSTSLILAAVERVKLKTARSVGAAGLNHRIGLVLGEDERLTVALTLGHPCFSLTQLVVTTVLTSRPGSAQQCAGATTVKHEPNV